MSSRFLAWFVSVALCGAVAADLAAQQEVAQDVGQPPGVASSAQEEGQPPVPDEPNGASTVQQTLGEAAPSTPATEDGDEADGDEVDAAESESADSSGENAAPGDDDQSRPAPEGTPADSSSLSENPQDNQADRQPDPPVDAATPPATADAPAETEFRGMNAFLLLAIVVALLVVPVMIGNACAKKLRMPDHSWRISLALGTIAAAAVVCSLGEIRKGPDLAGGITLIYEVENIEQLATEDPSDDGSYTGVTGGRIELDNLIGALTRRINPSGTKEVTIREYGATQIEIIVPKAGGDELQQLKDKITNLGELEFRIVVSQKDPEHEPIEQKARELSLYDKDVMEGEEIVARWVPYNLEEFGPVDEPDRVPDRDMLKRIGKDRRDNDVAETLVLMDSPDLSVTGQFLERTWSDVDNAGQPAVSFRFDSQGAARFGLLTGRNLPNESSGQFKYLGILLNRELQSAPSIESKITDQGIIRGRFTQEEVDSLVDVLNAGSLPAALNTTPLSEEVISPTLGATTVRQGAIAIVVSLILVLIFMLFYYRFAGMVACLALAANLVLVVGTMVLLKADFTLPGLAGLVLTVGMSVDANVLIFERMREELARGSALRMAIRNGFEKAKSTIYDANVTTMLTGIVLFWIGTDQIKGFATTLIIGILMSMYTALFCSRIVFEISEKQGWLRSLKMTQIVHGTSIDFLRMTSPALVLSGVLIAVGLVAVFQRGRDILNIDFTGGVSASMVLKPPVNPDAALDQGEIRDALEPTVLGDRNLLVVQQGADEAEDQLKYMIYARMEDEEVPDLPELKIGRTNPDGTPISAVQYVQGVLQEVFGDNLQSYSVSIENLASIPGDPNESDGNGGSGEENQRTSGETSRGGNAFAGGTHARIVFDVPVAFQTVDVRLGRIIQQQYPDRQIGYLVRNPAHALGSAERFVDWDVDVALPVEEARPVFEEFEREMDSSPLFPLANRIGGQVAGDMQKLAALAIFFSLLCIIGYIWLRFQQVMFGLAAVLALVHDVLVTLGMLAVSAWLVNYVNPVARVLQLEPFQVSLPIVAAFLTIIGYSLNDTIVIFDRIREVRGKSPNLTRDMINTSINQTLSRTLLTSFTTFLVVAILYFFGGPGIHGFAFSLVVGVIAGTYSTVFIASPVLLWMSKPTD